MADVSSLQTVELGVLGPLQVRQYGVPVTIPGAKPRAILTMLGLHSGSVVPAHTLIELLWGDDPPRTAAKALQTHISSLRRTLGDGFVLTEGTGWTLGTTEVDASRYKLAAKLGREAAAAGDTNQAVARFEAALSLWRGTPELPDGQRGASEKTRWIEGHAALVEDRADALLATGRAAEIIGELEAAVADAPLRERRWGQLMLALYRAGRQGEALGAYQRAKSLLAEDLGVDPGPDLRRLESAIVAQDAALEIPVSQHIPVTRAVTFLLTDIEGSTAAWEADAGAMAVALARHDELVEQVVTSRGGRLIKTRGEGDATFSVFDRPSAAAAAAIELQEAIAQEPWALREPMRIRVALHTGEVELRDGDYFGRAVNRAARLRSLAAGGQILCSGATAELVIDSLPDDVVLVDLGMRQLKNLARAEHVFELRLETDDAPQVLTIDEPMERPGLPAVLVGPGPFVGRGLELERLLSAWQTALAGGMRTVLIAGEPGVGKTRLAGEWSRQAYEQGAVVLYGRCDEDLGAPYQPFAEALRSLVPCLGSSRLRGLRGVEALLPLVPGLTDVVPDLAAPPRADADTERYALFDAVVALLGVAATSAPIVVILDDLHWAAKPTLLLLRHLLRFGEQARVQIVGTYRSTDLDRSHPLASMLADLHRDGTASRLQLSGLDEGDVKTYVAEAGYDDEELARALASVTGGNPFFLIEALRHVDESGGVWDQSTLPQGVREAVSRRLSRLPAETNKALAAAAVVGSRFAVELVERVVGDDLVDAFDEACKAGIVIEEPGGRYRFNHAIVRQSLLAELASVRRMRLHQRIATTLESERGADDELLAELAYHYFECAWAGNAAKAVEYCRRAAEQAMARLAYEGAADLYDKALHALEELDDELPDRDDQQAELLVARCEALLAAGDVVSATGAVSQLQGATHDSARLAAWGTCFDGQLSMLIHPERLDEIEAAVSGAANKLAELDDAAGEANAHTVRAACLARLGRIADCEIALDRALTAARRAHEHRRVNAVLAGAPLAALWGPNPVPRAGGRCLDVVRLLRITTDSPAVEATSTRCQAVLEAFRGRAAAARRMIDSARRTVTELGLRHALLEVEHFAGIVELVADDPASAEPHLRQAYNGFRRMGLDTDTAEAAALLGRACLALGRDAQADELCTESERLAGHALKASIAWRTLRAQLLARRDGHDEARRVVQAAVALAERTDLLVDHGDACLALATVLNAAGDAAGARAAAERATELYERKGAAALAEKARRILGERVQPSVPVPPEAPIVEPDNACVRAIRQLSAAVDREAWAEYEQMLATDVVIESRRKIVGYRIEPSPREWTQQVRRLRGVGAQRHRLAVIAVRGERLALTRLEIATEDTSPGAPQEEVLQLNVLDEEGRIERAVFFDVEDIDTAIAELDAAHARLEEPHRRPPLENAATRMNDRMREVFASRRWDDLGELFADDLWVDDRRRGLRRESDDRATEIANLRALADLGIANIWATPLALRGNRLCLSHVTLDGGDSQPEAFGAETLAITEVDADGSIVTLVAFDPDDFDAAFAELDARYIAGEAASHADTWSLIAAAYAALDRHELPPTTPDFMNVDHRQGRAFAPGELIKYLGAAWELAPDTSIYIAAVHRLSNVGAIVTHAAFGTSQEGLDAEWRETILVTFEGNLINHCEVFDEADIDAALARFEQLSHSARGLENAACQVGERIMAHFAARDWDAMAELLADDFSSDDRRRVVGAGVRHGRDAEIANARAIADLGITNATSTVIATRGRRLRLARACYLGRDQEPEAFRSEILSIIEIDHDERIVARISFDLDDIDAAFEELDARYLAGEAAAYAATWSVIAGAIGALNRQEAPSATPDWLIVDRRRLFKAESDDLTDYLRAARSVAPAMTSRIEAVHRLNALGAVVTYMASATSEEGFDAEWRFIDVVTVDGDRISRVEVFDEADLDPALARSEQLSRPRLENAATQINECIQTYFMAGDWDALSRMLADDYYVDDRRRVVNDVLRHGRDAATANLRAMADLGVDLVSQDVIATRDARLALSRIRWSDRDQRPNAFHTDALAIVETNADNQLAACVLFDPDDIDAAFDELDARYLAGEAAAHAHTWSLVIGVHAAFNLRELPAMPPDLLDHRPLVTVEAGDPTAKIRAMWDFTPDLRLYIEAVHRLSDLGAVLTQASYGTSQAGFEAEWRIVELVTIDGDRVNRGELFEEADIDAAIARFEQLGRPAPRLENAATRVVEHFFDCLAARDWDAMAKILADDISEDDRRLVVNAGIRQGRDVVIRDFRVATDIGIANATWTVVASRGEHLALTRARYGGRDREPEAFHNDVLHVVELNADEKFAAVVVFDLDDIDDAFEELDSRYFAGEAATYAEAWQKVRDGLDALNRHESLPTTWGEVAFVDHRRVSFAPGDFGRAVTELWELVPDARYRATAVHALGSHGAVASLVIEGSDVHGNELQWARVVLVSFAPSHTQLEIYDEDDLDVALARFEELRPHERRLENAATRVDTRFRAAFAARDWDAMAAMLADDICSDDRRRVVGAGIHHGRDARISDLRAIADLGATTIASTILATRGESLALARTRARYSDREQPPETFQIDVLHIVEIDATESIAAAVVFDPDDLDAAFEELDARYLAGEAAAHAHTWSVMAGVFAALNRRELPPTAPDWVNIDHRRGTAFAPGDLISFLRATWDLTPDFAVHIETVHRLTDFGAAYTIAAHGTSRDGFDAEWRVIAVASLEGDQITHCEIFEEADIDAALARFDELHPTARRLENAASQVAERYWTHFAAGDLIAMADTLAADLSVDDRRRVVNAGTRHGRDAHIEDVRADADVGFTNVTSAVIATRGAHLALTRGRYSTRDQKPEAFHTEVLHVGEIDAKEKFAAVVVFDPEDIDAAFEELDARYLAGEAAAHARTWSVIVKAYAALNRHELSPTTADWVNIDHRHGAPFAPGDLIAYLRASWDQIPDMSFRIEAVHRLSDLGAVYTQVMKGTSHDGFDAEWRLVEIMTVEGDLISRAEIFDEADIDAALAKFDELSRPTPRLENAASRWVARYLPHFTARDWDAMAEMLAEDICTDDRRRVVNAGVVRGRDVEMANLRAIAEVGVEDITSTAIATREEHLVLNRTSFSVPDWPEELNHEVIDLVEITADNRGLVHVLFDPDDVEAAFEELDARYLAGEAAPYSQTWSAVTGVFAALARHEMPSSTPDWLTIDHRRGTPLAHTDLKAITTTLWDLTPNLSNHVEAVHLLNDFAALFTQVSHGSSQQGFDAEWRMLNLLTVDGGVISGCELFDEADLDAALARFEELHPQAPRPENAARRVAERFQAHFAARDWDAMAEILADDFSNDDRRRVVGAGVRHGRDAQIADMRAIAGLGITNVTSTVIATRGERLVVMRLGFPRSEQAPDAFIVEFLSIIEINADNRVLAHVAFDIDNIDAAFAELDARYIAGEAAAHAHTWSVIARGFAAFNRRELPDLASDWVNIDHRRARSFAPGVSGDMAANISALWDQAPDVRVYIEAVHRLSDLGAVFTQAAIGTSSRASRPNGGPSIWRRSKAT